MKANWEEDVWVIQEVCGEKIALQSADESRCCCLGWGEPAIISGERHMVNRLGAYLLVFSAAGDQCCW